uniref:Uncharacterized protein n=1 Tax=Megaselia scalaris TaxID=36166 RepID=T1GA82_MEGSC
MKKRIYIVQKFQRNMGQCCWCCSFKSGCIIWASIQILLSIFVILFTIISIFELGVHGILVFVIMVMMLLNILVHISLIYGANMEIQGFLIPAMVTYFANIICTCVSMSSDSEANSFPYSILLKIIIARM